MTTSEETKLAEQMVFERLATHLLTQNKKSIANLDCAYRTADGLKCAVGPLLDDLSDQEIARVNNSKIDFTCVGNLLIERGYGDCLSLLRRLQYIHDRVDVWMWRDALKAIAAGHEYLDGSFIDKISPP